MVLIGVGVGVGVGVAVVVVGRNSRGVMMTWIIEVIVTPGVVVVVVGPPLTQVLALQTSPDGQTVP